MHLREKVAIKMLRKGIQVRCTGIESPGDSEVPDVLAAALALEGVLIGQPWVNRESAYGPLLDLHVEAPHLIHGASEAANGALKRPRDVVIVLLVELGDAPMAAVEVFHVDLHVSPRGHFEPVQWAIPKINT